MSLAFPPSWNFASAYRQWNSAYWRECKSWERACDLWAAVRWGGGFWGGGGGFPPVKYLRAFIEVLQQTGARISSW